MTTDNGTTDIIVITPEQQIENALVSENVTDKVIASLKEKYGSLRLESLTDQESYLEVKGARRNVRKVGILAETICKKGREDAIKTQRLWITKEKEVLDKIAKVQDPLDAEIKRYEDEQNRIQEIERKRKEQEYMDRQTTLFIMGAKYSDGSIVLADVSYETSLIREANDDIWEAMLSKYKDVHQKLKEAELFEEQKRKERQEIFAKQQEELKRQQLELEEQQAQLRKAQEEINRQKKEEENRIARQEADRLREIRIAEDIRVAKEQAAQREREKIEQEQKDAEEKRKQEEQQRVEELAKSSDRTKWSHFLDNLASLDIPEMRSSYYKSRINIVKQKIKEITEL